MTDDKTPKPGARLSPKSENAYISKFRERYRRLRTDQTPDVPTWTTFRSPMRVEPDILSNRAVVSNATLLVFFEYLDEVYEGTSNDIGYFLATRQPWEDYDLYLFPPDLRWCIAFTHLQAQGIYVFLAGDTEGFLLKETR